MKQTAEEQIKELKQQLADANEKIAQLMAIIKLHRNQIFGKKTEIMESVVNGQQSLFSEQEMDQLQDPDISVTKVTEKKIKQMVRHRKAKQSGQRTTFLDGLPQVNGVIVNTDLKLSEITGLKMYFFTGLNAVLYVVPCNLSCDMIYQKF